MRPLAAPLQGGGGGISKSSPRKTAKLVAIFDPSRPTLEMHEPRDCEAAKPRVIFDPSRPPFERHKTLDFTPSNDKDKKGKGKVDNESTSTFKKAQKEENKFVGLDRHGKYVKLDTQVPPVRSKSFDGHPQVKPS